ncbi:unnamed protein product [Sympodiomycopsis kandeliae]
MAATSFWKPGTGGPTTGSSVDRATESEDVLDAASVAGNLAAGHLGLQAQRARLPIAKQRNAILWAVEKSPVTIIVGQTGCGKTTQIPQYLLEAGWAADSQQIGITQPRRISATSVASRVAIEAGSVLGDEVGYSIRFEELSHPTRTRIKFLTDGMLFRECMSDPLLTKYSVIMVDEAHERGAYTDLLLMLLKKILRKRSDLRIIISSATIDARNFLDFFQNSSEIHAQGTIISLEGRTYPVQISHLSKPCSDYVKQSVETVWSIHLTEGPGDILVFLTGREEIDACLQMLADKRLDLPSGSLPIELVPLHAGLTTEDQVAVFAPVSRGSRKCIVATNIAETSVTIDGIKYVIDCGYVKQRLFNPRSGIDILSATPISKASATQRAGRAGRTSSGKCFRLYPAEEEAKLAPTTSPELARTDVTPYVLQLKALGIDNLAKLEFLPPAPPTGMMVRSLEFLSALGALDDWGRLTSDGERMAQLPLEPMIGKALLASESMKCTAEMLTIAAMTSVSSPFMIPDEGRSRAGADGELERRKFTAEEGDALTLLNVFNTFVNPRIGKQSSRWCSKHRLNFKVLSRAVSIRSQLARYLVRFGINPTVSCEGDSRRLLRCLTMGFFKNAARREANGAWRNVRDETIVHIHPSSVLFNREPSSGWVLFGEVIQTTKIFIRDVAVIERDWLPELAPHYYELPALQLPHH